MPTEVNISKPAGRWRRWVVRTFSIIGIGLAVAAVLGAVHHHLATRATASRHPCPGVLYDVGGHRLHLQIQGTNGPTVVIDAGMLGGSYNYKKLAEELAGIVRVCTYDRAGYGWSEPGPLPRTSQQIVKELHTLLDRAGIKPPYILLGHSFGGLNMRLFASNHPGEVAGLILVDALNTDLRAESRPMGRSNLLFDFLNFSAPVGTTRLFAGLFEREPSNDPVALEQHREFLSRTVSSRTVYEEWTGMSNWVSVRAAFRHLGEIPVTVISRRIAESSTGDKQAAQQREWAESQRALLKISDRSRLIIANTDNHCIQYHDPKTIVQAVREMTRIRASGGRTGDQ